MWRSCYGRRVIGNAVILTNKIKGGNYAEMQIFIKQNRASELKEFCL